MVSNGVKVMEEKWRGGGREGEGRKGEERAEVK